MKKLLLLSSVALLFSACAAKPMETAVVSDVPANGGYMSEYEAYKMQEAKNNRPNPSLWTDVGSAGTIFLDYKGRRIGDIVVVNIVENSSATNSTSNSNSKSTTNNAGVTAMMGLPLDLGVSNFLGTGTSFNPNIGTNTANTHSGQGNQSKTDTVSATIAARIIDIMPSGNLVIEGHREIVVDQEKQTITVKGIVRQKDINADNTVASTSIADAQISYSGAGAQSQAAKKGWLSKALDVIWPF